MDNIISFEQIKDEQDGIFSIRNENGELKDIMDWEGQDWEYVIEDAFAFMAHEYGCSKYDILADFIHQILSLED